MHSHLLILEAPIVKAWSPNVRVMGIHCGHGVQPMIHRVGVCKVVFARVSAMHLSNSPLKLAASPDDGRRVGRTLWQIALRRHGLGFGYGINLLSSIHVKSCKERPDGMKAGKTNDELSMKAVKTNDELSMKAGKTNDELTRTS